MIGFIQTLRAMVLSVCVMGLAGGRLAANEPTPALTLDCLAKMSSCQLAELFRNAKPGEIPCGALRGRPIYCPNDPLAPTKTAITRMLWKGKIFCTGEGYLVNQWAVGKAIRARIEMGTSWLDGQPAIITDYAGESLIWRNVRDEIREVAPGLYLGAMYVRSGCEPKFRMFFALQKCDCCQ